MWYILVVAVAAAFQGLTFLIEQEDHVPGESHMRYIVVIGWSLATCHAAAQTFTHVPLLPGDTRNGAADVSGDGSTVVGFSGMQAFRWRDGTAPHGLGTLPGLISSGATATSLDGTVVVGASTDQLVTQRAFRWTQSPGMIEVPDMMLANGISGDGTTVVGYTDPLDTDLSARRWSQAGGTQSFAPFIGTPLGLNPLRSFAFAANHNGTRIVGRAIVRTTLSSPPLETSMGFVWTPATGTRMIPLTAAVQFAGFHDITPDGSVVVGISAATRLPNEIDFMRWTPSGGYQVFEPVVPFSGSELPRTSADGNAIIAGQNYWSPSTGVITIQQLLTSAGCDYTGWTLTSAVGISDNGRTLTGNGTSPTGVTQAWIATVPTPGAATLATAAAVWGGRRKRLGATDLPLRASQCSAPCAPTH
jgi:probable HAF family extracellular repeat protein